MRTYKGIISKLPANGIFVFGSNTEGRHGKGAALVARQKFGAVYGKAKGKYGQSFAIVTKDLTKKIHPSVSSESIKNQIDFLYGFAMVHAELDFYVAYSGTGSNLNGYSNIEMAKMFHVPGGIPANIIFEESFFKLMTG